MPYMSSFERAGLERGLKEGRKAGRREGRREGQAALLASILEMRFGPLPEEARQHIAGADGELLETWAKAAIDAPTLEAVLPVARP